MARENAALVALVLSLLSLAGLAACGTRAAAPDRPEDGSAGLARNALPGLVGRTCHFVSDHDQLPAFGDLARIGTRGNVALWGMGQDPADSVVLSIRYDMEGRLAWVEAVQASLAADQVRPLERLLLDGLSEEGPVDWGIRVRVVGGDIAGVEPSVICPAEPRRGLGAPAVPMPVTRQDYRALEQARGRPFPIEISIDELGRISDVRLARSSGAAVVDQFLLDWIRATQFYPKLHDGISVASTIERTVVIPRRR